MQIQLPILRTTCSKHMLILVSYFALLYAMNSFLFEIFVFVRVSIILFISPFEFVPTRYTIHEAQIFRVSTSQLYCPRSKK